MTAPDIGWVPGEPGFVLHAGNRAGVQRYLIARGLNEHRVMRMRDKALHQAYSDPTYLAWLLTRGDYTTGAVPRRLTAEIVRAIVREELDRRLLS